MPTEKDFDLTDGFRYVHELFMFTLCEFTLGKMLFEDYNNGICAEKELSIIIIDALFSSVVLNLYKLFDTSNDALNIYMVINKCNRKTKEENPTNFNKIQLNIDKESRNRLWKKRNKTIAHSDLINLNGDISENYPLYISDIEKIIFALSEVIILLANRILNCSIGGRVGTQYYFHLQDVIKKQYNILKDKDKTYSKIFDFMKQNNPQELLSIIYSE